MKRINGLFDKIISIDNLVLADKIARRGKTKNKYVLEHDKNQEENIKKLHIALKNKTFATAKYNVFIVNDGKERIIHSLIYYPDRIVHQAILNVIGPILTKIFIKDTFSCIKGRGIHGGVKAVKKALIDVENTKYCLKLDIRKFYPSINHDILKNIIRRKIKDKNLLWLLDNIIDSTDGIPLGNSTSQYFGNLYLSYFDHWVKENKKVKYYFRYADDIVILHSNKEYLHVLFGDIKKYIENNLKLEIKDNHQIFPVKSRGIDFLGYVFYHTHIRLRKKIKKQFIKMVKQNYNDKSFASYNGWIKHCNGKHLIEKFKK